MEQYLKKDIAKILNKPIRTIQYWTDEKLVIPDIEPSQGKGKARVYSKRNLIEFAMIEVMCGPGQMYLELYDAKFILKILRNGGVVEGYQHIMFAGTEDTKFGSSRIPKGVNVLEDFYTSTEWGKTRELACVQSTGRSLSDEKAITNSSVEGFFIIPKDENQFVKIYRDWISCIEDSYYVPLARQIIFVSAIRNTAMDMYGIKF